MTTTAHAGQGGLGSKYSLVRVTDTTKIQITDVKKAEKSADTSQSA